MLKGAEMKETHSVPTAPQHARAVIIICKERFQRVSDLLKVFRGQLGSEFCTSVP